MDWYPWFPLAFRRKTYKLSLAEDGAYRRLIDEYMMSREPLPDDDTALARILGVARDEWAAVSVRVRGFFRAQNGQLVNKKCEEEIRAQDNRKARYSARGQKAAFERWSKNNAQHAKRMLVHATRHNKDKKEGTTKESEAKENGQFGPSSYLVEALTRKDAIRRYG